MTKASRRRNEMTSEEFKAINIIEEVNNILQSNYYQYGPGVGDPVETVNKLKNFLKEN